MNFYNNTNFNKLLKMDSTNLIYILFNPELGEHGCHYWFKELENADKFVNNLNFKYTQNYKEDIISDLQLSIEDAEKLHKIYIPKRDMYIPDNYWAMDKNFFDRNKSVFNISGRKIIENTDYIVFTNLITLIKHWNWWHDLNNELEISISVNKSKKHQTIHLIEEGFLIDNLDNKESINNLQLNINDLEKKLKKHKSDFYVIDINR